MCCVTSGDDRISSASKVAVRPSPQHARIRRGSNQRRIKSCGGNKKQEQTNRNKQTRTNKQEQTNRNKQTEQTNNQEQTNRNKQTGINKQEQTHRNKQTGTNKQKQTKRNNQTRARDATQDARQDRTQDARQDAKTQTTQRMTHDTTQDARGDTRQVARQDRRQDAPMGCSFDYRLIHVYCGNGRTENCNLKPKSWGELPDRAKKCWRCLPESNLNTIRVLKRILNS